MKRLSIMEILATVFFYCILPFLHSCTNKVSTTNNELSSFIDLTKAIYKPVYYSELYEKVEYEKLETTSECLIGNAWIYVTDKYIITNYFKTQSSYLFDRKSGKFLKQIGRRGQGPNDYLLLNQIFDENESILYFNKTKSWLGINIETGNISTINCPKLYYQSRLLPQIYNFHKINTDVFIVPVQNFSGNDSLRLVVFDRKGNIIKTFPNHQTYIREYQNINDQDLIYFEIEFGKFYQYQESLFFKESAYNDTIFKVTRDSLVPHIRFYLGDKQPRYHLRNAKNYDISNYYSIDLIGECDRYIFFAYKYLRKFHSGYYDKMKNQTFICKSQEGKNAFFINDMDKIPSLKSYSMNIKGEIFGLLTAEEIVNFRTTKNGVNPRLQHLNGIKYDDNPVVVIATPKRVVTDEIY